MIAAGRSLYSTGYSRACARNLKDQLTRRLLERLNTLLSDEPDRPSQAEIACEFGMTENAVKQAFHRLRQRYRELLREEVAQTVATPAEIEDELRHLIAALRS